MKKSIVIYGSSTGTCQGIAQTIADKLGIESVVDVASLTDAQISENENLILGTSTWGCGELQDDWYSGIEKLKVADLKGKTIAIFGCGDSASYSDTFCGAMGVIYNELNNSGANFIGCVSTEGYTFDASDAVVNDKFIGLALDNDNEDSLTEPRIDAWVEGIKAAL